MSVRRWKGKREGEIYSQAPCCSYASYRSRQPGQFNLHHNYEGSLAGGSIEALLEYILTTCLDDDIDTLVRTFHTYITPRGVMQQLREHVEMRRTERTSTEAWYRRQHRIIQSVARFVLIWTKRCATDFIEDAVLREEALALKTAMQARTSECGADICAKFPAIPVESEDISASIVTTLENVPHKIAVNFRNTMPEDIAKQICLIEERCIRRISARELQICSWEEKYKKRIAPNVTLLIEWFYHLTAAVTTEVLQHEELSERARSLEYFIAVAQNCFEMNNYNSAKEVLFALNSSALRRLRRTWRSVSAQYLDMHRELYLMTSSEQGYKNLRLLQRDIGSPGIPHVGLYLTDLTFISDGNPDFFNEGFCINFLKCQKVAEVMRDLERPQRERYNFVPLPQVQRFLETAPAWDKDRCHQQSILLEDETARDVGQLKA